jgi:eukaryotic-like serine/threonine-protein kinase
MSFTADIEYVRTCIPDLQIERGLRKSGQKAAFEVFRNGSEHLALKVYDIENIRRIDRELRATFKIDSPYVIKMHEFYIKVTRDFEIAYSLEEFIEGEEMGDRLSRRQLYSPKEAIGLLKMLLEGLEACSSKDIVHRDIKPGNIMLRKDGSPVIIDFGLARHLELESLTPTEWMIGPGTPNFAPPEVLENKKGLITGKSDLYSLGITAYMMVLGRHPYLVGGESREDGYEKMLRARAIYPHQLNSEIPESLSYFVMTLMAREIIDRFRDAGHALEALQKIRMS